MTPGWKTSEAWFTAITVLLPVLVFFHLIPQADLASLTGSLDDLVTKTFALVSSAVVVYKYIHSRQTLKAAAITNDKPG